MRYPFVLFDIGETLVGPRAGFGAVYASVLGSLGIRADPAALERELRAAVAASTRDLPPGTDRYRAAHGDELGYWRAIARRTLEGVADEPITAALVDDALARLRAAFAETDAWLVYDDVRPMLARLSDAGCRLGVVSNWDSRLPALLERLDLARWFETITVSHLEGVEKPSPRLFRLALERLGAAPSRTLYVGNVPAYDLVGGHAAGLDVLLVDRGGADAAIDGRLADLSCLPAIVAGRAEASIVGRISSP